MFTRHLVEAGFGVGHSDGQQQQLSLAQPVFRKPIKATGNAKQNKAQLSKQYITPEHNEMIRYVQQSWRGVERDYKKSNVVNTIDLDATTKSITNSKAPVGKGPLLLTGAYHHTTSAKTDLKDESFQPFDLEAFWGDRILKRLTQEL